jgi:hypothetical protein
MSQVKAQASPELPPKSFRHMLNETINMRGPEATDQQQKERDRKRIAALLHSRVMLRDAMGRYKGEGLAGFPSPGPNEYTLASPQAQGFTIQGKTGLNDTRNFGPGPVPLQDFRTGVDRNKTGITMGEKKLSSKCMHLSVNAGRFRQDTRSCGIRACDDSF